MGARPAPTLPRSCAVLARWSCWGVSWSPCARWADGPCGSCPPAVRWPLPGMPGRPGRRRVRHTFPRAPGSWDEPEWSGVAAVLPGWPAEGPAVPVRRRPPGGWCAEHPQRCAPADDLGNPNPRFRRSDGVSLATRSGVSPPDMSDIPGHASVRYAWNVERYRVPLCRGVSGHIRTGQTGANRVSYTVVRSGDIGTIRTGANPVNTGHSARPDCVGMSAYA